MKKITLLSALAISSLFYNTAKAQIHLGLHIVTPNVRIVAQTPVYTEQAAYADDYYYLPEVDAYYSVAEQCYYYNNGGSWISAAYLPGEYRNYDWRSARRIEVREHRPYMNADFYRSRYRGNVTNWGQYNDRNVYANRGNYGRDDRERYDNRSRGNYGQPSQPDRRVFGQPSQPDRNRGNYGQPSQPDRSRGNYGQPSQPDRNRGNYGQPSQQPNRGQGGFNQQAQPSGNQAQPSNQNGGGRQRGNDGQHFTDRNGQGGQGRFNRS